MADGVVLANLICDVLDREVLVRGNVAAVDFPTVELLLLAAHDVLEEVNRDLV